MSDEKQTPAQQPTASRESVDTPSELSNSDAEKRNDIGAVEDGPQPGVDGETQPTSKSKGPTGNIHDVSTIPNGGLQAWLQVLGSFMIMLNTWGIVNTFGAYQTFYEQGTLFHSSSSNISWIGAIQAFMLLFISCITGPAYDAGHFRVLIGVGTFMVVFGQTMLSLIGAYWQAILAQALCVGIGAGLLVVPSIAIISTYFTTKLSFAIGIAASGSSIGGVIYPIVFHRLIDQIGFGWATRVLGFLSLAGLIIPNVVMKMRVKPAAKRKLIDLTAFTDIKWLITTFALLIGFMGLYIPFFYLQYYAIVAHITNGNLGFYLLAVLNAASVFGRIVPNFVADKVGPFNIFVPCSLASGILTLNLIETHTSAGIIVIAALYGFFSGTFVSIPPSCYVHLTANRGLIGTRLGMGFGLMGIGVLVGTPIGGAILGPENDFSSTWIFGGVLPIACGILVLIVRVMKGGWKLKVKV